MEDTTITIYDVAREADVSMATVSRVVNGNPNVKEATKKRVMEVVERLGYRPNAVARGLASKKTTTVGVVIPDISNAYFAALARGIDDIATMYKYNIILTNSDGDSDKEVNVINTLLSKQVDGLIILGNELSDQSRAELKKTRTPVVLAGAIDEKEEYASVNINYYQAMEDVIVALAQFSDKVAFVSGPLIYALNGHLRLAGYKSGLKLAKKKYDEGLVFETKFSYQDGHKLAERVKASGATSAFVADDETAIGLLNGMLDLGVKVPEEFQIVAANNSPITEYTRPSLSSVNKPLYDIGAVSMRLLTKLMSNEEIDEQQVILPHSMKQGKSTL